MKLFNRIKQRSSGVVKAADKKVRPKINKANKKREVYYNKGMERVSRRPLVAFLGLILILFGLIIISNFINRPDTEAEEASLATKDVQVYGIGSSPEITVQAVVEKSGVIKVVALGSGVVSRINVQVGQEVGKGANLLSMSTNYQGGNALSVQRQLAQVQYQNVLDTYDTQKDILAKQIELVDKNEANGEELRNIANNSIGSTESLIALNNDILATLEAQQEELENTNVGGANDDAILQTKQLRSQFESANLQLESSLKNAQYNASDSGPQSEIGDINKEIALDQLEIQEKALELNKEVSRLNLVLARISEAIMYPASPVAGVVERIYVREGQVVSPGTPLFQITGASDSLIAVALLNKETASSVSRSLVSTLFFGDETYQAVPFFVSSDATDGSLYSAQYAIPQEYTSSVTDNGYILISIPIDMPSTGSTIPFIPIDAVFQTQDQSYVFIAENGLAVSHEVDLGNVIGRYVEVKEGLGEGDQVILNRNVVAGDPVKIIQ